MVGNVLNGEISDKVFALRDHRLEHEKDSWQWEYIQSTTNWISYYKGLCKTPPCTDAGLSEEPEKFGYLISEGDSGLFPTLFP